jgi:hypothetical protein
MVMTNVVNKNREKMNTSQTAEMLHIVRQAMLYPVSGRYLSDRLALCLQRLKE